MKKLTIIHLNSFLGIFKRLSKFLGCLCFHKNKTLANALMLRFLCGGREGQSCNAYRLLLVQNSGFTPCSAQSIGWWGSNKVSYTQGKHSIYVQGKYSTSSSPSMLSFKSPLYYKRNNCIYQNHYLYVYQTEYFFKK